MTTSFFDSVVRAEDIRCVTDPSRYVDDVRFEGARRAAFVRSIMSHARLSDIDVAEERSASGAGG